MLKRFPSIISALFIVGAYLALLALLLGVMSGCKIYNPPQSECAHHYDCDACVRSYCAWCPNDSSSPGCYSFSSDAVCEAPLDSTYQCRPGTYYRK